MVELTAPDGQTRLVKSNSWGQSKTTGANDTRML